MSLNIEEHVSVEPYNKSDFILQFEESTDK